MHKKTIKLPKIEDEFGDGIQLSHSELLELTRREHAAQMAQVQMKLAESQSRVVRLEIEQAARVASEATIRTQTEYDAAIEKQRDFAQSLAKRYDFDWKTHSYNPDTGIVRRVMED